MLTNSVSLICSTVLVKAPRSLEGSDVLISVSNFVIVPIVLTLAMDYGLLQTSSKGLPSVAAISETGGVGTTKIAQTGPINPNNSGGPQAHPSGHAAPAAASAPSMAEPFEAGYHGRDMHEQENMKKAKPSQRSFEPKSHANPK